MSVSYRPPYQPWGPWVDVDQLLPKAKQLVDVELAGYSLSESRGFLFDGAWLVKLQPGALVFKSLPDGVSVIRWREVGRGQRKPKGRKPRRGGARFPGSDPAAGA